jgi:putative acetyltransferase
MIFIFSEINRKLANQSLYVSGDHMLIRSEEEHDRSAVHALNISVFETPSEANLVNALRQQALPVVSLVAEENGAIVGHIMFSPVSLSGHPSLKVMGLAPMAVTPEHQQKGIGSALVRAGLEQCRQLGFVAVVVLGHPKYYPRFGFSPSSHFDIDCEYEVPEEVFMAIELQQEALSGKTGRVQFHAAFSNS